MATLRIITDRAALDSLIPAWKKLVAQCSFATVFQTPEWSLGWWRALTKNSTPFCVAMFEQDRLVGLAPLYLETRLGARVLQFMGIPFDHSNRALVESAYAQEFAEAFAVSLRERAQDWDVLRVAELEQENSMLSHACASMSPELVVRELSASNVPVLNLPERWETYWERLASKRRRALNRSRRQLEMRGAVSFRVLTNAEQIARELEKFFRARLRNWSERRQWNKFVVFQQTRAFYDTLSKICTELAADGQVWLARLDADDRPISWRLVFRVNDTLSDYMTTFDVEYAAYSPGHLVAQELIRSAIAQGVKRYELGRGAQPYKFWLRATARTNQNLVLFWKRPRSILCVGQQIMREEGLKTIHRIRLTPGPSPETKRCFRRGEKPAPPLPKFFAGKKEFRERGRGVRRE